MTRILMVSEPCRYGVFVYLRSLVRFLHAQRPDLIVDLAYSSRRDSPELAPFLDEIRARGSETLDLGVGNGPESRDLPALWNLLGLIRKTKPAVIHAHSSKAGGLTRLLKLIPGVPPVLYTPHCYYGMMQHGGMKERAFNFIESVLGRLGTTHTISTYERKFALETLGLPSDRIRLVFTGINLEVFRPASDAQQRAAREELGLPTEGRLLVTVGRDSYQKNYDDLYSALEEVLPGADWRFAHAGEGSVERCAKLAPAARERAHAFPYIAHPETLYDAADAFVITSRGEGFGLSACEALASGLVVIMTATTGQLTLGEIGVPNIHWLPNPMEAGAINKAVGVALRQWAEAPPHDPQAAPQVMREWFNAPVQQAKLVQVYRELAEGRTEDLTAFDPPATA